MELKDIPNLISGYQNAMRLIAENANEVGVLLNDLANTQPGEKYREISIDTYGSTSKYWSEFYDVSLLRHDKKKGILGSFIVNNPVVRKKTIELLKTVVSEYKKEVDLLSQKLCEKLESEQLRSLYGVNHDERTDNKDL